MEREADSLHERLADLRARYPLKTRLLRAATALETDGTRHELGPDAWHALHDLCDATTELAATVQQYLGGAPLAPGARDYLQARWREVVDANAEVQDMARPALEGMRDRRVPPDELAAALRRDTRAFKDFARELDVRLGRRPHVKLLGFGEISTALSLDDGAIPTFVDRARKAPVRLVYKRMALFGSCKRAQAHIDLYREYNRILRDGCGLNLPWFGDMILPEGKRWRVYVTQERLPSGWIGTTALRSLDVDGCVELSRLIFREYTKVWRYNDAHKGSPVHIGLDGQITNWAVQGFDPERPHIRGDERLYYLDTNAPFMLKNGKTMLDHHIVTHRSPRVVAKLTDFMVEDGLAKYHKLRVVVLDYLSNLSVQHRPDVQEACLALANEMRTREFAPWTFREITMEEVKKYERADVASYKLLRSLNRIGDMFAALRAGRHPHPIQALKDVHHIVTNPIF